MKKTIVTMAALLLMVGGAMACAQQPEQGTPEQTEQPAPDTTEPKEEKSDEKSDPEKSDEKSDAEKSGEGCEKSDAGSASAE